MKKKVVACMMALSIALIGCGNSGNADTNATPAAESTTDNTDASAETDADTTEDATTGSDEDGIAVSYPNYNLFVGGYQDATSQRASMDVTLNADEQSVHMCVIWGSSAVETNVWEMDASYDEDERGLLLVYSNCTKTEVTYDEDGNEFDNVVYENGEGYFTYNAATSGLSWVGAADEECIECEFLPMGLGDVWYPDYSAFVGGYQDSYSQRASAEVTLNEDEQSVHISIMWGSSAVESNHWEMDCTFDESEAGAMLVYTNGQKIEQTYDEDGNAIDTVVYDNGEGYFDYDPYTGSLAWTGAVDEDCRECVFERMPE